MSQDSARVEQAALETEREPNAVLAAAAHAASAATRGSSSRCC